MRRAAKVDENHQDIVRYLLARGCSVQSMAAIGCGCPDLLVAKNEERTCVIEIKDGEKAESERRLNDKQRKWRASWLGKHFVCETLEDCAAVVSWLEGEIRA